MANYPTRLQQREHHPEEENERIQKQFRYSSPDTEFYEKHMLQLRRQLEYRPFFSRLLFYQIYVVLAVAILYTWLFPDKVVPILLQFIQRYIYLIILYLLAGSINYPIYRGKSYRLYFRPRDLRWQAVYAVEIRSSPGKLPRLATLLHNMPFLTMYQLVDFDKQVIKLVVSATQPVVFFRITSKKLSALVASVLGSTRVVFQRTQVPAISFHRFHYLKTRKLYLQLDQLVKQLLRAEVGGQLIVVISDHKDIIDEPALKLDTLYSLHVGFATSNLDKWMGLINSISQDVKHRPYISYLLARYFPRVWIYGFRLLNLPGLSWYTKYISRNLVYADKLEQAFQFPRFDRHSQQIFQFRNPGLSVDYRYELGNLVNGGVKTDPIGIPLSDLAQGGIITGAIGTGKTTMRLHLLYQALSAGLRVIDFDLKGDATRFGELTQHGKVIIPNRNFHLNPFLVPKGFSTREYANVVLQSFVETIPAGEELSPPQLHLLTRAIYKTVDESGNARTFFKNLYIIGHQEQQIVDNKQQNTAQALITRFDWMQSVMHHIFWQSSSSLLVTDYAESNLFFDLSQLEMTATRAQIRFLINLVMARVIASLRHRKQSQLTDMIFLDETQILMPRRRDGAELTKLEQTVTTLRYKGVSVIATGVSAALMSPVLLDVGFVAQFRSENAIMESALGLFGESDRGIIAQLPPFHALVRSNSIGSRPVLLHTREFSLTESLPVVKLPDSIPLTRFELDYLNIWQSRLDALILPRLGLPQAHLSELQLLAVKFVDKEFKSFEIQESKLLPIMKQTVQKLNKQISAGSHPPLVVNYPQQFVSLIIYAYMLTMIKSLQYDTKLNLLDTRLESLVISVLDHIKSLTQTQRYTPFDTELVRLKGYIMQIQEYNHLDMADIAAVTVEIASLLENLARRLGIKEMGLTANLVELSTGGWLEPAEHRLLNDFVRKIRNPVVHGTFDFKSSHLSLIYRVARLTMQKIEAYRIIDDQLTPHYAVTQPQSSVVENITNIQNNVSSMVEPVIESEINNLAITTAVDPNISTPVVALNESQETEVNSEQSTNSVISDVVSEPDTDHTVVDQPESFNSSDTQSQLTESAKLLPSKSKESTKNTISESLSSESLSSINSKSAKHSYRRLFQQKNPDSSTQMSLDSFVATLPEESNNQSPKNPPLPSLNRVNGNTLPKPRLFSQNSVATLSDNAGSDNIKLQPSNDFNNAWKERLHAQIFSDCDPSWLQSSNFDTIEVEARRYVQQRFTYYSISLNDLTKMLHQAKIKTDRLVGGGIMDKMVKTNISDFLRAVLLFYLLGYLDRVQTDQSKTSVFETVYIELIAGSREFIDRLCPI